MTPAEQGTLVAQCSDKSLWWHLAARIFLGAVWRANPSSSGGLSPSAGLQMLCRAGPCTLQGRAKPPSHLTGVVLVYPRYISWDPPPRHEVLAGIR
eukprot:scaffold1340_cov380-Prasinococcus_capsulatus_cf.AAC.4